MASWRLNAALTQWRAEINKAFPKRDKQSDGTLGDLAHQKAGTSEHLPDADGSVDAFDMDVDLDGTNNDKGPTAKIEGLKELFQKHPSSQLWIHNGQIANRDIGNWKRRTYTGANSHKRHVHWQTRPSQEKNTTSFNVDRVLNAVNSSISSGKTKAGTRTLRRGTTGSDVAFLQRWLGLTDDGIFGAETEAKVKAYQRMRGIAADGVVGVATWKEMQVIK